MNILVDVRLLGRGGVSGIEEYTTQVISKILDLDTENHYKLFYSGFKKNALPKNWTEKKNVSVIDWKLPNKLLDITLRTLKKPDVANLSKSNLIFSPHFNLLKSSLPRIITFHDLSFMHHPNFFRLRQKFWHWLQDYKTQALNAVKIIANSAFTKSDLVNTLGIPEEKVVTIYPGVNPEFKKITDQKALEDFKNKHNLRYPFILYLGTLEPRKNIIAVIRAFSWALKLYPEFKNLRLILAGRPGWLYKNILLEAKNSPSKEKIIFWGQVENKDRIFLYNLAKAFVYPSFFEGFGFPPLEAQSCGCPIIVSNRASLPEIIRDTGILIDPWRTDDLTEKLRQILTDQKLREEIEKKGFENVKRFSWQKNAEETLELFNSIK